MPRLVFQNIVLWSLPFLSTVPYVLSWDKWESYGRDKRRKTSLPHSHLPLLLHDSSSLSILSCPSLCTLIKPPKAQSIPNLAALEVWETHISYILFLKTPWFSDAQQQLPHTPCTPCQRAGQPRLKGFEFPSFLPTSFPELGNCKTKRAPKCHQLPLLAFSPLCVFSKMTPHNTMAIAACGKLLGRQQRTNQDMENTTTRVPKPPNPVDPLLCCQEEPKGMAAPWMARGQQNPVVLFGSSAQLQSRVTQRPHMGTSSHHGRRLALPTALGQAQLQLRHRSDKSLRANPLAKPTLLHGREEATSWPCMSIFQDVWLNS